MQIVWQTIQNEKCIQQLEHHFLIKHLLWIDLIFDNAFVIQKYFNQSLPKDKDKHEVLFEMAHKYLFAL